ILDDPSAPTFGDLDESKDPSDGILDDTSAPTFRNLDESKDPPDGLGRNQLEDVLEVLIREQKLQGMVIVLVGQKLDASVKHLQEVRIRRHPVLSCTEKYLTSTISNQSRNTCRAAKSEETYSMSTNCAEKLAEDIENFLKIRGDPDLDSSPSPQVAKENQMASKPKGIKLKRKEIRGSARPIGGLEKSSQKRKKKKNEDSPAEVLELQPVTEMQPQPYATVLGNLEVPNDQAFLHVSRYYAALDASTSNPTHVLMTPENQGLHQQGRSIQQFDTDLYNLFN
ncbi:hypothetical protein EE612_001721, partial [Oryza sativa]